MCSEGINFICTVLANLHAELISRLEKAQLKFKNIWGEQHLLNKDQQTSNLEL